MMGKSTLLQRLGCIAAAIGIVVMFATSVAAETTLERIKREGYVRVAFANEPPFAYASESGELTGESIAVAKAIFERMGVPELVGMLVEWGSLIPGLKAGRFDAITASMWIRPKRCEQIAFTEPTHAMGTTILVEAGNPLGYGKLEDVAANANAKIAIVAGTVGIEVARDAGINDDPNPRSAGHQRPAGRGKVRPGGLSHTHVPYRKYPGKAGRPEVERARPFASPRLDYASVGLRKEDTDLLAEFNKHLKDYIGTKEHLDAIAEWGSRPSRNARRRDRGLGLRRGIELYAGDKDR